MKKILLIICIFLFGTIYYYKFNVYNEVQLTFLTEIEEVDTSLYNLYDISNNIIESNTQENVDKSSNEVQNNTMLININTASKEALMSLTGIGESIAENIINYREENGNFKSIDEIKNVKRIGDKTYEKIKDYITIGGENDI